MFPVGQGRLFVVFKRTKETDADHAGNFHEICQNSSIFREGCPG